MDNHNNDDEFILNVLNETLRTSEGDLEYDSDNIVELFGDDSVIDPNYECNSIEDYNGSDYSDYI